MLPANAGTPPTGARPSVAFGEGRRPEATTTHVKVAEFQGPLALLLTLIEARQLDVLTVPLGGLADAYLDALATLDDDRLGNVSSFIAIASQLILIKSRAMLPRQVELPPGVLPEDEPDPEAELRARLLLYRAHRDAGVRLQAEAALRVGLFRREPAAAVAAAWAGARPSEGPPLDPNLLVAALDGLARIAAPLELPPEVVPRTITLAERAEIIREAIRRAGTEPIVLQELLRGVRDRVVVAVTFLALLELMKRRELVVTQAEPWGPIVARATTPDERGGGAPVPADEPLDERLESFS
jgi:segregation and condensation protein A